MSSVQKSADGRVNIKRRECVCMEQTEGQYPVDSVVVDSVLLPAVTMGLVWQQH